MTDGKADYDTGNHVKCREKCADGRTSAGACAGRCKGSSVQIPEYGIEFIHYRRRSGNGKGAGNAGRGGRY